MPFANTAPAVGTYPSAAQGHNIGSAGGAVADQAVVVNVYSEYDPFSIARLAQKRHGKRPSFAQMMDLMGPGYNGGAKAPTIGHYEINNWVGQLINVGVIDSASGGAGNAMDIELGTVNMTDPGITAGGSDLYASNIRVSDLILLPGNKLAIVTDKNDFTDDPHIITISPLDSTLDLDSVVTAGETYAIVSSAHGRGTALPEGLTPTTFKYTNEFAIIKEAVRATGSELTNEPFVQVYSEGETIYKVMNQDAMDRFERKRGGMLCWGEVNDNVNVAAADSVLDYDHLLPMTEGFMSFQSGYSYQNTYNAAAFTLDEIDQIAATYEGENVGTRDICSLQGNQYTYIIQNTLDDKFDNSLSNAMIARSLTGYGLSLDDWQPVIEGSDFWAWLGWQGVRRANFLFHFRMMHEFVAPDGAGSADYDYPYDAIYLPLSMQKDVRTGEQRPSIGYQWKQYGNYSRKMVYGELAGAGVGGNGGYKEVAVNEYDSITAYMITELAFHGSCPNKIVYHTQA